MAAQYTMNVSNEMPPFSNGGEENVPVEEKQQNLNVEMK